MGKQMNELPQAPGTYLLQFICNQPAMIEVGKAGQLQLLPGIYLYVGSAFGPGGLAARLRHHLRERPVRQHWHLDYLRPYLQPTRLWYTLGPDCWEHDWAQAVPRARGTTVPLQGLGASDCHCRSHLFFRKQHLTRSSLRNSLCNAGLRPPRIAERRFARY